MHCPRCAVENDEQQKSCLACGLPLGLVCERCENLNNPQDSFCGSCGYALEASVKGAARSTEPIVKSFEDMPRQYSLEEIGELLLLRRALGKDAHDSGTLDQSGIDKLFE